MTATYQLHEIAAVARKILQRASGKKLWAFYGPMGVGKTTLIKSICHELLVTDVVSSPTFSLVNEYQCTDGESIFHFDFYRIKNITEVYDIGYEEYFYSGKICLIEWPEKIDNLLNDDETLRVMLNKIDDDTRSISF
jgi:tRNA threonylcarbamoyladenosine biosynthesis protein TsaE